MPSVKDGPASPRFAPLKFRGRVRLDRLARAGVSRRMADAAGHAPTGDCVGFGIPFNVGAVLVVRDRPIQVKVPPTRAEWLVFMHTSDLESMEAGEDGLYRHTTGPGRLGEHAADYVLVYADGSEARAAVRRRYEVGAFTRPPEECRTR